MATRDHFTLWARRVGLGLALLALINFAAFAVLSAQRGGSPDREASRGGRYYLSDHGKLTEVDRASYEFSRLHTWSLLFTHSLGILGLIAFGALRKN